MNIIISWGPVIIPPVHACFDKILICCTKHNKTKTLHPPSAVSHPHYSVTGLWITNALKNTGMLFCVLCFYSISKFKSNKRNANFFVSNIPPPPPPPCLQGSIAHPAASCSSCGHHCSLIARCSNQRDSANLSSRHIPQHLSARNAQPTLYYMIIFTTMPCLKCKLLARIDKNRPSFLILQTIIGNS